MDYEIEFRPVGDASKAGDAICVRYGLNGQYQIAVIDGGTADCGDALVDHIRSVYGASAEISHMVSTHPDTDHASGLRDVLENIRVRNLWIHGLWTHAANILPYFADKRWTVGGLADAIRREYPIVQELIDLANEQGTRIAEPFAGATIGPFTVLSPTAWAYERLIPQFRKTPAPDERALRSEQMWLGTKYVPVPTPMSVFGKLAEAVKTWMDENWNVEHLREGAVTAAENETSTVLYGQFGTTSVLLTGDAGVNALWWSCNQAEAYGLDLSSLALVQVPHHGSRSNVTPNVLNRLLGPILPMGSSPRRDAIVSCPKDDESHPRKMVVNAFTRRGARVFKTQGSYFRKFSSGMPYRSGEVAAVPFGLFNQVEAYD